MPELQLATKTRVSLRKIIITIYAIVGIASILAALIIVFSKPAKKVTKTQTIQKTETIGDGSLSTPIIGENLSNGNISYYVPFQAPPNFDLIGTLSETASDLFAYDSNDNGYIELIYEQELPGVYPAIFYENIDNEFSVVHELGVYGPVYEVGDFDEDGKTDLITGHYIGGYELRIYESIDSSSYPTELVWSAPLSFNVRLSIKGGVDLDQDGKKEIVVNNPGNALSYNVKIYENDGDNDYQLVYESPALGEDGLGSIMTGDLDQDGMNEFLTYSRMGKIVIYENDGNNSYHEISNVDYGIWNGYATIGDDLDNDGTQEIFAGGEVSSDCSDRVGIFESNANDNFVQSSELEFPYNGCGVSVRPAVGNAAKNTNSELLVTTNNIWHVFQSADNDQYTEVYYQDESYSLWGELYLANSNNNAYQEIIIGAGRSDVDETRIYEYIP